MNRLTILIFTVLILSNCSDDENIASVNIRLSNISDYNFKNITVNTSTGNVTYDDLDSGQLSEFKAFDLAYQYAFIELSIDGEIYTHQPIDYVGASPLDKGYYTYELNANPQSQFNSLTLSLIEE